MTKAFMTTLSKTTAQTRSWTPRLGPLFRRYGEIGAEQLALLEPLGPSVEDPSAKRALKWLRASLPLFAQNAGFLGSIPYVTALQKGGFFQGPDAFLPDSIALKVQRLQPLEVR